MRALRYGKLLQFNRGQGAVRPHRLQDGILGPRVVAVEPILAQPFPPFPSCLHEGPQQGKLLDRDRAQHLVPVLEPQPLSVHEVEEHPGVRALHPGLEDEVVIPPQDGERIELHRPEIPERLADPGFALGVALPVQSHCSKLVESRLFL